VDRSFISHIEEDPKACSLVRSMVVMGEALGLDVVIEGVEREGQLQHVIDHAGGAMAQGYCSRSRCRSTRLSRRGSRPPTVPDASPNRVALPHPLSRRGAD
jgi:EAL domain-containing protein (putative c-di-GMP-specific phosphodiesterase class I)